MTECLFCLEGTTEANELLLFDFTKYEFACKCKIHTHANCWMLFIIHKGRTECPICHKVFGEAHQIIQVPTLVVVEHPVVERNRCTNSKISCCVVIVACAMLLGFIMIRHTS
jgi:hypothetical protein